ncbi:hypothetical protein PIB30_060308 [Stylosanthes scabra]|uniref:Uncharacterized protein n=1 Tax=Stylosanthes scabra TaxID=79078 RepID=A0ABU6QL88_9FABA|nr:hypothetical protein [Stylosanthes scabra]
MPNQNPNLNATSLLTLTAHKLQSVVHPLFPPSIRSLCFLSALSNRTAPPPPTILLIFSPRRLQHTSRQQPLVQLRSSPARATLVASPSMPVPVLCPPEMEPQSQPPCYPK